jgi:hypothetical protein
LGGADLWMLRGADFMLRSAFAWLRLQKIESYARGSMTWLAPGTR